jgi:hypothetical protein
VGPTCPREEKIEVADNTNNNGIRHLQCTDRGRLARVADGGVVNLAGVVLMAVDWCKKAKTLDHKRGKGFQVEV